MSLYTIFTDSGCDIVPALLAEWDIHRCALTFRFEDEDVEYADGDLPIGDFYDRMRAGGIARTAAISTTAMAR